MLYKKEKIEHPYPFCWRCDSPLLYYAINSWFIKVSIVRDKLLKKNKEINWYPDHIKDGRFGKWLEGAKDWALSRFKFWGTPLPIWRCECGNEEVIGSLEELKKKSTKKIGEIDLHKPTIDEIKLKCKCGKEMTRIKDVIDCWYDSGSASFAQFHYPFENKKEFERRFPYDFISEAVDQTRGWFYTLHVISLLLFDKPAYKNVICAGHVLDEKGEKMSKSKGNIIKPDDIIQKSGIDAVRLQFCTTDAGNPKRFSYELMKESVIPFLTVLKNCYNYYIEAEKKRNKQKLEDKWIISKLNSLTNEVTNDLDNYSISEAYQKISNFVDNDFSRTYIKITRERDDTRDILREVLRNTSLLIAPFAPYISEYIYQDFDKKSVHLSYFPKTNKKLIDKKLEEEFHIAMQIIEKGLSERDKSGIGLKWPLAKAVIFTNDKISDELLEIIKSQLNVKDIKIKKDKEIKVELDTKLTKELEAEGYAREISRKVQAARKNAGLVKTDFIKLEIEIDKEFGKLIETTKNIIKERTNAVEVNISSKKSNNYKNKVEDKIKDEKIVIYFEKV